MTRHKISNLLLFLFAVAVLIALWLSPNTPLQAAPVFQSGLPTPTFTPTATPDLQLSRKTASQSVATVGDVLTYTLTVVKTGGPAPVIAGEFLRPELGNVINVTHTGVASFFDYSPAGHALAWVGPMTDGRDIVTITYQAQVLTAPVGGILTNTAQFGFLSGNVISREAAVFIQTPTPTFTPTPTDTPTPTNTPTPTATATPTNLPTVATTVPVATFPPTVTSHPTVTPTLTRPAHWPKYLPETGTR